MYFYKQLKICYFTKKKIFPKKAFKKKGFIFKVRVKKVVNIIYFVYVKSLFNREHFQIFIINYQYQRF